MSLAADRWQDLDGWCASRNVDSLELEIDRFVNLVYYWATRNMSEEDRQKFDRDLSKPVRGSAASQVEQATGKWSREAELAQFRRG